MLFRRRKNPNPMPPWLKWGVLLFLVFAFASGAFRNGAYVQKTPNWNLFSMENYKAKLVPGYGQLQIAEIEEGAGAPAACGQEVTIRYREQAVNAASSSGGEGQEPQWKEQRFSLADAAVPETLRESIVGMKQGGKRDALVPPERTAQGAASQKYEIELIEATPALPEPAADSLPLKILDARTGTLQPLRCGVPARAHFTVWSADGARLFDSREGEPVAFTPGEGKLWLGIEQGALGMQGGGIRTLIIPPMLQTALREKENTVQNAAILHKVALSAPQALIVDIELLP